MAIDEQKDSTQLIGQIRAMSPDAACQFLSLLTLELTILARGSYDANSNGVRDPVALRELNECQHFLLGILRRLVFHEEVDIPLFAQSLSSLANGHGTSPIVRAALERSLRLSGRA